MWRDVRAKELDSLGSEDSFAFELVLAFQQDVEAIVFLPRQRVRVRGNMGIGRVIDQVAIEAFALEDSQDHVACPLPALFPANHR